LMQTALTLFQDTDATVFSVPQKDINSGHPVNPPISRLITSGPAPDPDPTHPPTAST
jgi:hypothetical protein